MSKDSSAKYYQNNKKDNKRNTMKDIKVFLKTEKKTKNHMALKNTKSTKRWKTKGCWVQKKFTKWEKTIYYNYKKLFSFRKSGLLSASIFKIVWIHFQKQWVRKFFWLMKNSRIFFGFLCVLLLLGSNCKAISWFEKVELKEKKWKIKKDFKSVHENEWKSYKFTWKSWFKQKSRKL